MEAAWEAAEVVEMREVVEEVEGMGAETLP